MVMCQVTFYYFIDFSVDASNLYDDFYVLIAHVEMIIVCGING